MQATRENSLPLGMCRLNLGVVLLSILSLLAGCSRLFPETIGKGGSSVIATYVKQGHPQDHIVFKTNHTLYFSEGGHGATGTYEISGGVVTLKLATGKAWRARVRGKALVEEGDGSIWLPKQPITSGKTREISDNQAGAVGLLRTLNTVEVVYASTYNHGYAEKLCYLGPPPAGTTPGPTSSGLVDSVLAGHDDIGVKSGYRFVYVPGPRVGGKIVSYKVHADPIVPGITGQVHYYTDQSEVVRMNRKQRAGAHDLPLGR